MRATSVGGGRAPSELATGDEVAGEEDQHGGADPGQRAVEDVGTGEAPGGDPAVEQGAGGGADLDAEGEPAEGGAARFGRDDHPADGVREGEGAAQAER